MTSDPAVTLSSDPNVTAARPERVKAAITIPSGDVRADWEAGLILRRSRRAVELDASLPPPNRPRVETGRGHVTLRWDPVEGAVGYVVHVAPARDGPWEPLDHGGGDHLVVPADPYPDTTGEPGIERWYAVASTAAVEARPGRLSEPVRAASGTEAPGPVEISVDASAPGRRLARPWRPMIGSEHLSLLLSDDRVGGQPIGDDLIEACRLARQVLGIQAVRAHAILGDDLGAYREIAGRPVHDFRGIDAVYDHLMATGMRPVVELSFMPRDLAADPSQTVFQYRAGVSPPKDLGLWEALVGELVGHLAGRYGLDELVEHWSFEVWNEANLQIFWAGSEEEYLALYDASARAVKAIDPRLRVGGPSSAAGGWLVTLLDHTAGSGAALDFLSTHSYGVPPFDAGEAARVRGRPDLPIWWTEWGPGPSHNARSADSVFAAAFLVRGMKAARDRAEALSHWVLSDHFEELGRPQRLLHGGFGLLTVGNLRKPRWHALRMCERLGAEELPVQLQGDGAESLVDAWGSRDPDGRVAILVWNGALDQSKLDGDPALDRVVELSLSELRGGSYRLTHARVDVDHSNIVRVWEGLGGKDWPIDDQWETLRAADRLDLLQPPTDISATNGSLSLSFELPMPAVSLLELVPV